MLLLGRLLLLGDSGMSGMMGRGCLRALDTGITS